VLLLSQYSLKAIEGPVSGVNISQHFQAGFFKNINLSFLYYVNVYQERVSLSNSLIFNL
jgi:hypothetical protein